MNGVAIPSVSPGSSQREARVMWTPQVMVPSGGAAAEPDTEAQDERDEGDEGARRD